MPYQLPLPEPLGSQGWRVKIRDKEQQPEDPHATVIFKTEYWRWGLREREFLDDRPPPRKVPTQIVETMLANVDELVRQWDLLHPEQRVYSEE